MATTLRSVLERILLDEQGLARASTRDLAVLQGLLTVTLESVDDELRRRDRLQVAKDRADTQPRWPV